MITDKFKDFEKVHVVEDGGKNYFRQFRQASDGRFVIGIGATESEAIDKASQALEQVEMYLSLPPNIRLQVLLNETNEGNLGSTKMEEAIRLIAKILEGSNET